MTDRNFIDLSPLWEVIEKYGRKWQQAGFTFPDAERCVAFIIEEAAEAYSDYWRSQDADKFLRNNEKVIDTDGEVADTLRMSLTLLNIFDARVDNFVVNSQVASEQDIIEFAVLDASELLLHFRAYKREDRNSDVFRKAVIISTRRLVQLCLRWFAVRGKEPETMMLEKMQQTDDKIIQEKWLNSFVAL